MPVGNVTVELDLPVGVVVVVGAVISAAVAVVLVAAIQGNAQRNGGAAVPAKVNRAVDVSAVVTVVVTRAVAVPVAVAVTRPVTVAVVRAITVAVARPVVVAVTRLVTMPVFVMAVVGMAAIVGTVAVGMATTVVSSVSAGDGHTGANVLSHRSAATDVAAQHTGARRSAVRRS